MLDVKNLTVAFPGLQAVQDVSFCVRDGESVGIVGESGSGKSLTALAVSGLLPENAVTSGTVMFWGRQFIAGVTTEAEWRQIRGKKLGLVFQEPSTCLNPLIPVGRQVREVIRFHQGASIAEADRETERLFSLLGLHPPRIRIRQFPHQLSGGMKQRVMLAAAICCMPNLLIADEPTTALDVSVQAEIIHLLRDWRRNNNTSLLLISHDLGVIAQVAERVLVMCAGRLVEEAPVEDLFANPYHPYTRLLLESLPRIDRKTAISEWVDGEAPPEKDCGFAPRCSRRGRLCRQPPPLVRINSHRTVRCHYRW